MPSRRALLTGPLASILAGTRPPCPTLGPTLWPALAADRAEAAPAPGLAFTGRARVRALDPGGTVALSNGERVRLLAIDLPQAAALPERPDAAERQRLARLSARVLDWLEEALGGQTVALWTTPVARDRHGRLLAHLTLTGLPGTPWLQAALVAAGLARVATMPGAAAGASRLLSLEADARAAGRGLWPDPLYRVRAPAETWPWLGTFQIVRGIVVDTDKVGSRVYLNFGHDWRRDFTVMAERPRDNGLDVATLLDLRHQMIQARGWLFAMNGPMIALDHAAALETRVRMSR